MIFSPLCRWIQAGILLSRFLFAFNSQQTSGRFVLVTGATGYIGRSVVRELVSRNIPTVAVVRSQDLPERSKDYLKGAEIVSSNVCDFQDLEKVYEKYRPSSTICCLASRSGVKRDVWAVDYEASLNSLRAQESLSTEEQGLNHFVLLSAYCVGKPRLQFHHAKLKLEARIRESTAVSHSIIRPTAFFKSVDGQFENVVKGFPTLYFGDGSVRANPISEYDLAEFLVNSAINPYLCGMLNHTTVLGGPDKPLTKFEQLQLIYDSLNIPSQRRNSLSIPIGLLNGLVTSFDFMRKFFDTFGLEKYGLQFEDAAEITRIVRYYAQEDMVTEKQEQMYGRTSLLDHFQKIARRGGHLEEIDRMTTTTGVFELFAKNQYMGKE